MLECAAFIVAFAILGLAPCLAAQERPPQPAEAPPPVEAPPPPLAPGEPTGYAGKLLGGQPSPIETSPDFVPISDRWRLGLPNWNRYERPLEAPYVKGKWWDPYNQSVIKGDYPILRAEHLREPVGDQRHALRGAPHSHRQRSQRRQSE